MTGKCLCGAVSVTIDTKPEFIHDCNCTLCRKSGGAWSYLTSSQVAIEGKTSFTMRDDKDEPAAQVHSCPSCFTTTHFDISSTYKAAHGPVDMVGVNMRLFSPEALEGVPVRFPDGHKWSGAGEFEYRRPNIMIGAQSTW